MKHILVVEDDVSIGNLVEEALAGEGYRVTRAYSGTEALYALDAGQPDLMLLDLMLPGLSGEEVLPRAKGIPVIVLSARAGVDEKVGLLLGGAADYITKPFAMKELLARVAVALRPAAQQSAPALACGALRVDPASRTVSAGEQSVNLTRTEYAILKLLAQNPGQVLAKSVLLDRIGADTPDCTESSLKTHVSHLRKKLREAGAGDCVEAVWGIGFRLRAEDITRPAKG